MVMTVRRPNCHLYSTDTGVYSLTWLEQGWSLLHKPSLPPDTEESGTCELVSNRKGQTFPGRTVGKGCKDGGAQGKSHRRYTQGTKLTKTERLDINNGL